MDTFENILHMYGIGSSPIYVLAKMFLNIIIMCHLIACLIRVCLRIEIEWL